MRLLPRVFHRRRHDGGGLSIATGPGRAWRVVCALLLLACSQAALALGLGDLRVLSKPGQPFLAEIPVISNEPGELENARVALASPATFARVGLERPQGLVGDLQFQFAQDARGRAVIRVTSQQPVQVPSLSFLIEVDWGQGRLVREYSALVDAPNTAAAIAEPAIDAPAAAASNAIAPAAPTPTPAEERPAPVAATPTPAAPAPRPAPIAPTPAPAAGDTLAPVQRGQTLSHIAAQLARGSGQSLDQTMVALLRANPDAFIRGNLNLLKQGAVLRTPQQDALAQIDAAEAAAIVREQTAQWRQARAPVPQPAQAQAQAQTAVAPASAGARLEIAPAVAADGGNAGTKSGTGAGDEGDMVANQQLQQTREDLAARDAEVQELRARVEELEKLKAQQQQLIALKDSDLAAAQKRLAQTQAPAPAPAGESGGWPLWLWGGLALLLLGVGAWLLSRRRKPSPLPPLSRSSYDTAALAAAVPVTAHRDVDAPDLPSLDEREDSLPGSEEAYEDGYEQARDADRFQAHLDPHLAPAPAAFDEDADEPWRQPALIDPPPADLQRPPAPEPAPPASATLPPAWQEPAWHPAGAPAAEASDASAGPAPTAGRERLELAVAYMDLGDNETARTLLAEVASGGDPAARAEALQLLARLG